MLADDGFEEVADPREGDVVIYYDDKGSIVHSGIVVGFVEGGGRWKRAFPRIWSKWGKGREVIHTLGASPYGANVKYFRLQQ